MRQFLLGVGISAVFAAGCVAGAVSSGGAVSKAKAAEGEGQRFAYLCFDAASAEELHQKANQAAARGWQMVSGAGNDGGGMVWCFRQPQP